MGVDLALLPIDHDGGTWGFSHTLLRVPSTLGVRDAVMRLDGGPVPDGFTTYLAEVEDGVPGYGRIVEDAYGAPLLWARAGELAAVLPECPARAYVAAMDPKAKVALYWH